MRLATCPAAAMRTPDPRIRQRCRQTSDGRVAPDRTPGHHDLVSANGMGKARGPAEAASPNRTAPGLHLPISRPRSNPRWTMTSTFPCSPSSCSHSRRSRPRPRRICSGRSAPRRRSGRRHSARRRNARRRNARQRSLARHNRVPRSLRSPCSRRTSRPPFRQAGFRRAAGRGHRTSPS